MTEFNIYCDESCHLEHNRQPIVVLSGMCSGLTPEEIAIVEEKE